jgi:ribA/ribD-fused uncharacterized protein
MMPWRITKLNNIKLKYKISEIVLFQKSKEPFGEFSNMHMGFPFSVNGIRISCVESIYQALKFTDYPLIQKEILEQKSPMAVKFKSRRYNEFIRSDWDQIKVGVMEFCVKLKIYKYSDYFYNLFLQTGKSKIAEFSSFDTFWAVKQIDSDFVYGSNVLGEIIMKIREEFRSEVNTTIDKVVPSIQGLKLLGTEINQTLIEKPVYSKQCSLFQDK